jgi:hypothetical protein
LVGLGCVAALVLAAAFMPVTHAGFAAATGNASNSFSSDVWGFADRMAVWRTSGSSIPQTSAWDGSMFGLAQPSASVGSFRIMQGATSTTRDEAIVVGVASDGTVAGELWNGSSWTPLPALGTVTQTYWWGVAVAYEATSGDAMVVYVDGTSLRYRTWNGLVWSAPGSLTASGGPRHLRLAADPSSDEMVVVVSNSSSQDSAQVWDGDAWTSGITLDSVGTGNDRTDISVAYEHQSGTALVVFGRGTDDVFYRSWNGSWSAEAPLPGMSGGYARWTTLGSDPSSDRIAMGVLTDDASVWLAMWDGTTWTDQVTATNATTGTTEPAVAVAFESISGDAMAVYGRTGGTTPWYRTWTSGTGWAGELSAPDVGAQTNSIILYPSISDDDLMLAVQDDVSGLHWIPWNGSAWGPDSELETNSGETKNQPFLFL